MLGDFLDAAHVIKALSRRMPGGDELGIGNVVTSHAGFGLYVGILQFHQPQLECLDITRPVHPQIGIAFGMRILITTARAMATFTTDAFFNLAIFLAGDPRAMALHAVLISLQHIGRADSRQLRNSFVGLGIVEEGVYGDFVRIVFVPSIMFSGMAVGLAQAATACAQGLILLRDANCGQKS